MEFSYRNDLCLLKLAPSHLKFLETVSEDIQSGSTYRRLDSAKRKISTAVDDKTDLQQLGCKNVAGAQQPTSTTFSTEIVKLNPTPVPQLLANKRLKNRRAFTKLVLSDVLAKSLRSGS